MPRPGVGDNNLRLVKKLYYEQKFSMREIGETLGVSIDAVVSFMRRHQLPRRSLKEANNELFNRKAPSFKIRNHNSARGRQLRVAGVMLYWSEGYKGEKSDFVDFSNSDPEMIRVFLNFLRSSYKLDEKKLRVLLYCYSNQNVAKLIKFWSRLTEIPVSQFTKPYVREDFRKGGREMPYGLVHIRYIDKKLLLDLKRLISIYQSKFASVVP